jgi:hypothetical protein
VSEEIARLYRGDSPNDVEQGACSELFNVTREAFGPRLPTISAWTQLTLSTLQRGGPIVRPKPTFDLQQQAEDTFICT